MFERLQKILDGADYAPAEVQSAERLTPNMVRVTLKSNIVEGFSPDCIGGHFKLIVPERDETAKEFEALFEERKFKSEMRTYTVRYVRPEAKEIDVDIVVHGDVGRVGAWAQKAGAGDVVVISSAGDPKLITNNVTRIIAAADMTAFPALATGLEGLASDVQVDSFVEILSGDDKQTGSWANDLNIEWIVKPNPYEPSEQLIAAIKELEAPDDSTSVFVAGEYSMVASLRSYFRNDLGFDKKRCYISSYWKAGLDEPAHKVAKAAAA